VSSCSAFAVASYGGAIACVVITKYLAAVYPGVRLVFYQRSLQHAIAWCSCLIINEYESSFCNSPVFSTSWWVVALLYGTIGELV
jgi:hypothetical protein